MLSPPVPDHLGPVLCGEGASLPLKVPPTPKVALVVGEVNMAQEAPVVGTSVQAAPVAPEAFSGSLWVLLLEVLLQQGTVCV